MKADRETLFIQSKCGIVPGVMFDSSKEYILEAVDGILKRLDVEYLDSLLIHRPDLLVEPEEVAEAFDKLETSGKVRYFGVSNENPMEMELLKKYVKQPLCANQLQFGLVHTGMLNQQLEVNMTTPGAFDRDGSLMDYCSLHDITIQAWSPLRSLDQRRSFIGNETYPEINAKLEELAEKYGETPMTIAAAWILRHPADIQILSGSMKAERLKEVCRACEIRLTKEEWYGLYLAAGNILP